MPIGIDRNRVHLARTINRQEALSHLASHLRGISLDWRSEPAAATGSRDHQFARLKEDLADAGHFFLRSVHCEFVLTGIRSS